MPLFFGSAFSSFSNSLKRLSPVARARIVLACVGALDVGFLIFAEKPWNVEFDEGRSPRVIHHVAVLSWIAALINLFILGVLAWTAKWWVKGAALASERRPVTPRWFWPSVVLAMCLTAGFAFPRLGYSLWDDEEYNVRYSILGRFQLTDGSREAKFRPAPWVDTLFDYREPNNHVFHSILSRLSLETWKAINRPTGLPFTEWALRVPAFLFGLAGILTLGWFVKEFFGPKAGIVAAFLLAIHPWLVRYASEARGYSMVICLLPVAFVLWRRAIAEGSWKWWGGYALLQWALIYTYPGVLFALALLNILAIPILWRTYGMTESLVVQSGRWFVSNCIPAMACLQLMLPLYPQASAYFEYESARNITLGWPWVQSTLSFLLTGAPWAAQSPDYPSFSPFIRNNPWLLGAVIGTVSALTFFGFLRFFTRGWIGGAIALAIVLPPVMTFAVSVSRNHLIYSSYVIYMLPGLAAFVAVALAWLAREAAKLPGGRLISVAIPASFFVCFFLLTAQTRNWLVSHPLQPIKDSVLVSRVTLDPWDKKNKNTITASFCIPPYLYDGNMVRLESAEEFIALLKRADREQKKLVLNIGMPWAARSYSPKMWEMFNQTELFDQRVHLRGFDSGLDRIVATYVPGSATHFDFEKYEGAGR